MNPPIIGCLGIAWMLGGCATVTGPEPVISIASTNCADAPSELVSRPLRLDAEKPEKLTLASDSRCIRLNQSQAASAVLYELPEFSRPYSIEFGSHISGETLFAPVVQLFDESYELSRKIEGEDFVYRGGTLSTTIFVNPDDAKERYLLIHSNAEIVGTSENRLIQGSNAAYISAGAGGFMFYTGIDRSASVTLSHNGSISIALESYAPGRLNAD